MQAYYRVGSLANAARAKRILQAHGVHGYMKRRSDSEGCGYGVLVTNDSPQVARWLSEGGVTVYK